MLNLIIIILLFTALKSYGQEESEVSEYICDYDINNDNNVNVLDAVQLVDYIIN